MDAILELKGLRPVERLALYVLAQDPTATVLSIAATLEVTPRTIDNTIKRLTQAGLVLSTKEGRGRRREVNLEAGV